MTFQEAGLIRDVVFAAFQEEPVTPFAPLRRLSLLQGYDIYQIDTAFKLLIANERLLLAGRDDFEERFTAGLNHYGSGLIHILTQFAPDEDIARELAADDEEATKPDDVPDVMKTARRRQRWRAITPDYVDVMEKDKRVASMETPESFGDYCKSIAPSDPLYWQKIYSRIDLEYTSTSPKGNVPCPP